MKNAKSTDYAKFTTAAKELGAEKMGKIGKYNGVIIEAWQFEGPARRRGEGFMLAVNPSDGTIGVYEFVGRSGADVDEDIKWLMRTYGRVMEGKAA